LYTRWGDWLPGLCAVVSVILLLMALLGRAPVALK
jgi:apolipoprotein N-acyltransferase